MSYELFLILAQTPPPADRPSGGFGDLLIPLILFGVIFYFLIIRPQSKRQKEHQALIRGLRTGDRVVTSGGIHGLISNVKETSVTLKVADNVKIEVDKAAIGTVLKRSENGESSDS